MSAILAMILFSMLVWPVKPSTGFELRLGYLSPSSLGVLSSLTMLSSSSKPPLLPHRDRISGLRTLPPACPFYSSSRSWEQWHTYVSPVRVHCLSFPTSSPVSAMPDHRNQQGYRLLDKSCSVLTPGKATLWTVDASQESLHCRPVAPHLPPALERRRLSWLRPAEWRLSALPVHCKAGLQAVKFPCDVRKQLSRTGSKGCIA